MMKMVTELYDLEGELDTGSFEAEVSVEFGLEDNGIGHYEFWGSTYTDVAYEWTVSSFFIESITVYSEDGDIIVKDLMNKPENKNKKNIHTWDDIESHIDSQMESIEPPEGMDDWDEDYIEADYDA